MRLMTVRPQKNFFNLAMQDAGSQAERMNLVMQLLSDQGLTQAGEKWQENNGNLIEGNKATANLQEATAELAETMAPIATNITEIMTQLLEKFRTSGRVKKFHSVWSCSSCGIISTF